VPIIGTYANLNGMLLWIAFYLTITEYKNQRVRNAGIAIACLMVGVVVILFQGRTNYSQLIALMCIVGLFRPKSLSKFIILIPFMFIVVGTITAFNIKVPGHLTQNVSFSFFLHHFEAMGGISQADEQGLDAAAAGVPLRLGWWTNILEQEAADPVALITGLGYGRPLTNYVAADETAPEGVQVREPHNSFFSVLGRLGLVGAISWIWLHFELFNLCRKVFAYYRRLHDTKWINRLLIMLGFVVLTLATAIGEDALEKPFNIVPYYCFWGVILRLGFNIRMVEANSRSDKYDTRRNRDFRLASPV
jgi:O-antigen ligase